MRVVVAGGSGFVGRHLVASLAARGDDTVIVTREPGAGSARGRSVGWGDVASEIDGADAVVNLAGTSVGEGRWSLSLKKRILASRVKTTETLLGAIAAVDNPPRVYVGASGINYAGDTGDAVVDETTGPGDSFLARVCVVIERAAWRAPVRSVVVRSAHVLARDSAALHAFAMPHRFLVGRLGSGRQWFPWVHVEDLVRIYQRAIADESLSGVLNAVAPHQLRQRDAAREFARVLHRPAVVPLPALLVRGVLGEQADLVLHSARAASIALGGFEFRYRTLQAALAEALGPATAQRQEEARDVVQPE